MWLQLSVSYSGERFMPPPYHSQKLTPICVCVPSSYSLHTSSLFCLNRACQSVCRCLCVRVCVSLPTPSLVAQLYRRSTEDRRPSGQLQNNESLKTAPDRRTWEHPRNATAQLFLSTSSRLSLLLPSPSQPTQEPVCDVSRTHPLKGSCLR